jgi:hypothetical protein
VEGRRLQIIHLYMSLENSLMLGRTSHSAMAAKDLSEAPRATNGSVGGQAILGEEFREA